MAVILSLAKAPYYYFVMIFMAFVALLSVWNVGHTAGYLADFYVITLVISLAVIVASTYYIYAVRQGTNDEFAIQVGGISIGKTSYYIAVLVIAIWRLLSGYQTNHTAYGIAALWGVLWIVASLTLAIFTYVNYRAIRRSAVPHF